MPGQILYCLRIYAGIDPKTVQYLAGHENSKVTMDIYAKAKYNKPEELSSVVNNALKKPVESESGAKTGQWREKEVVNGWDKNRPSLETQ